MACPCIILEGAHFLTRERGPAINALLRHIIMPDAAKAGLYLYPHSMESPVPAVVPMAPGVVNLPTQLTCARQGRGRMQGDNFSDRSGVAWRHGRVHGDRLRERCAGAVAPVAAR